LEAGQSVKKGWVLTPEAFAKLLERLNPDPEVAGAEYEATRQNLIGLFRWRGFEFPEELADETLNRVARKLDEGAKIENFASYVTGVARFVLLEALKERERERSAFDSSPQSTIAEPIYEEGQEDVRRACLEKCLASLPQEARSLVLEYYDDEERTRIEQRKALAARLGLEINALRNRALRIRTRLEDCVRKCMKQAH
jgi:DNA-directed RNA polymerase specialized sigma24 family protein